MKTISRTLLTVTGALLIAGPASAAAAAPAAPATPAAPTATARGTTFFAPPARTITRARPAGCAVNRLCVYEHRNFGGQRRPLIGLSDVDWRNNNFPNGKSINDRASSIFNSSGFAIRLFRDTGRKGHVLCLAPGRGIKDLSLVKWMEDPGAPLPPRLFTMGDRISSSSNHRENIRNLHCNWRAS